MAQIVAELRTNVHMYGGYVHSHRRMRSTWCQTRFDIAHLCCPHSFIYAQIIMGQIASESHEFGLHFEPLLVIFGSANPEIWIECILHNTRATL